MECMTRGHSVAFSAGPVRQAANVLRVEASATRMRGVIDIHHRKIGDVYSRDRVSCPVVPYAPDREYGPIAHPWGIILSLIYRGSTVVGFPVKQREGMRWAREHACFGSCL